MPWIKHRLRDADVWAKVDAAGELVTDRDGRVEIVYKPEPGAKVYRAGSRNLSSVAGASPVDFDAGERAPDKQTAAAKVAPPPSDAIQVWTDGACTGNPGPAGIGVVVIEGDDRKDRKEISEYLGQGTNNIAELTAILRGLETVRDRKQRPIFVYSDSGYAIGLLSKGWKAKANVELVEKLRKVLKEFPNVTFVKVPGHAGVPENERCDYLGRDAIRRGR